MTENEQRQALATALQIDANLIIVLRGAVLAALPTADITRVQAALTALGISYVDPPQN